MNHDKDIDIYLTANQVKKYRGILIKYLIPYLANNSYIDTQLRIYNKSINYTHILIYINYRNGYIRGVIPISPPRKFFKMSNKLLDNFVKLDKLGLVDLREYIITLYEEGRLTVCIT